MTTTLYFAQLCLGFLAYAGNIVPVSMKQAYYPLHVVMGPFLLVAATMTALTGITEKNTMLGCSYDTESVDWDPAKYYKKIPLGMPYRPTSLPPA